MRTRSWLPPMAAAFLLLAMGGCSLPFGRASPGDLAGQALNGLANAPTLRHSGTVDKLGARYTVDVKAKPQGDMRSSLTFSNRSVEVLKVGETVFQRGRGYWAGTVDPVTLKVYADNWIRTQADSDLSPAFVIAAGELERDLRDHFKPSDTADSTVAGSAATKLTGREGDLFVTRSQPARALRFVGAMGFTSSSGLGHVTLDFQYPVPVDLQPPPQFIDPRDHGTWPAEFEVKKADQGACTPSGCELNADVTNQGGASVGQAVATFKLTDDSGQSLGSCTANIPPVAHAQTENVKCTVSGAAWASFTERGGNYSEGVTIYNPVYDD